MSVRKLKPVTPAQRFRVVNGFDAITTDKPEKSLLSPKKRTGGRNNRGKMTVRHRGGGHKKRYRIIDFKRNKVDVAAEVKSIEYDPNRSAFIALVEYKDGEKRYIIAQNGFKVGQKISSGEHASPEVGNALPLSKIPLGTIISCIELNPILLVRPLGFITDDNSFPYISPKIWWDTNWVNFLQHVLSVDMLELKIKEKNNLRSWENVKEKAL